VLDGSSAPRGRNFLNPPLTPAVALVLGRGLHGFSQWVLEAEAAFVCPRRPARRLRLQPAPAQAWEMVFFPPYVLQLGPFIIGKKENDQASRLENKET
jgi:hypothetical protein